CLRRSSGLGSLVSTWRSPRGESTTKKTCIPEPSRPPYRPAAGRTVAWRLSSRVWLRAHRATGRHVGHGASPSAAAAAPKGSDAVAELLGRCLLPGLWHRHAGELLQPCPRPLVAPPGVRVVVRPIRARKSPECAQDPSRSAPSSELCDSRREPSLVRSRAYPCRLPLT